MENQKEKFLKELSKLFSKYIHKVYHSENMFAKTSTKAYSIHALYMYDGTEINAKEILNAVLKQQ